MLMNKVLYALVVAGLVIGGLFGIFKADTPSTGGVTFENEIFKANVVVEQKLGIASSTPSSMLSVGSGSATSTVDLGKFCLRGKTVSGGTGYVYLDANGSLATTSTSCF